LASNRQETTNFPYFLCFFLKIISRLGHDDPRARSFTRNALSSVCFRFPEQTLWALSPLLYGFTSAKKDPTQSKNFTEAARVLKIVKNQIKEAKDPQKQKTLDDAYKLIPKLVALCRHSVSFYILFTFTCFALNFFPLKQQLPKSRSTRLKLEDFESKYAKETKGLRQLRDLQLVVPLTATLVPSLGSLTNPFSDRITIAKIDAHEVRVFASKERPLRIGMIGSDGKLYHFLAKRESHSDMRKNGRVCEFNNVVNRLLHADWETRQRNLQMKTFSVASLTKETGLLEWVPNTSAFRAEFDMLNAEFNLPYVHWREINKALGNRVSVSIFSLEFLSP
jgi:serine/threonine-protein kinase ATR